MILEDEKIAPADLARRTGWEIKPEGACKGERCVQLPKMEGEGVDAAVLGERLGMALVHDPEHSLWALGPESGGRALSSAKMPELTLPDRKGEPYSLRALRGLKVCLVAWASW